MKVVKKVKPQIEQKQLELIQNIPAEFNRTILTDGIKLIRCIKHILDGSFDDYITKPVKADQLLKKIREHIQFQKMQPDQFAQDK